MNVDIIIISFAKNNKFKKLTDDAITSLYASDPLIKFNVFVIESNKKINYLNFKSPEYNVVTIHPTVPFGYHRYLNIGILQGSSQYLCLCNNDLIFTKNWASTIIDEMKKDPLLLSASPFSTIPHSTIFKLSPSNSLDYGYDIRRHISGWCIFQRRDIYKKIALLDERFTFWYADNDYAETIKRKGIKHALIKNSIVQHIESTTLRSETSKKQHELTRAQIKVFENKWNIKK